jgi:hypothetical protein
VYPLRYLPDRSWEPFSFDKRARLHKDTNQPYHVHHICESLSTAQPDRTHPIHLTVFCQWSHIGQLQQKSSVLYLSRLNGPDIFRPLKWCLPSKYINTKTIQSTMYFQANWSQLRSATTPTSFSKGGCISSCTQSFILTIDLGSKLVTELW